MKRLLDDPRYAGELRADLLQSRSAGQDYQTAAKLLQLRAAFSDYPPPAPDVGFGAKLQQAAAHPGWKLAVLAALGGGAGLLAYSAAHIPARSALTLRPAVSAEAPASIASALPQLGPNIAPPSAAAAPVPHDATAQSVRELPQLAAAGAAAARRSSEASSSRREIAQLVRMRALLERDPAAAYRLAQRAEREFPLGVLAQERQALSIVALARTGAMERAHTQARHFFARYPQSPLRATVEAALQR